MDEPRRSEDSVVEALPAEAKTERIASMRRDLAELQRQLTDAQQRIATELQGRAEDAERIEALEARVAELEKAGGDLAATKTLLETRDAELATRTRELDAAQATCKRLENQLEDQRKEHKELAEHLEQQLASLSDMKTLVKSREAELAATTSARDTLTGELEQARRELDGTRAKARDFASQLVRFGQELSDGVVVATAASSESKPVAPVERPHPPPPPPPPRARPVTQKVEPIEVTRSPVITALLIVGGMIVGAAVTIAVVYATSSSDSDQRAQIVLTQQPPARPPVMHVEPVAEPPPSLPKVETPPAPTPPVETATTTDGVIVLPASAAGHRVFVDGKVVEVKGSKAVVACGSREVRIGSTGTPRKLDVACGGETAVPEDTH